jgi:hypothetical protein
MNFYQFILSLTPGQGIGILIALFIVVATTHDVIVGIWGKK